MVFFSVIKKFNTALIYTIFITTVNGCIDMFGIMDSYFHPNEKFL